MRFEFLKIGEISLEMDILYPGNYEEGKSYPTIYWIFGGGWLKGEIEQNDFFADYYAKKGYIVVRPEYRVGRVHGTTVYECISDSIAGVKYLLENAERLGIDTDRLIGAGNSAGGHLIAMMECGGYGLNGTFKALLLKNPVIDTSPEGYGNDRIPGDFREISPLHLLKKDFPQFILIHGSDDTTVPYKGAAAFCEKADKLGIKNKFITFDGEVHGMKKYPESKTKMREYFYEFMQEI